MGRYRDYTAIFMDVQMPILDGMAATRQLRQAGCATLIIGVTANADKATRKEGEDCGMDDLIAKPVSKAALSSIIAELRRNCVLNSSPHVSGLDSDPSNRMQSLRRNNI